MSCDSSAEGKTSGGGSSDLNLSSAISWASCNKNMQTQSCNAPNLLMKKCRLSNYFLKPHWDLIFIVKTLCRTQSLRTAPLWEPETWPLCQRSSGPHGAGLLESAVCCPQWQRPVRKQQSHIIQLNYWVLLWTLLRFDLFIQQSKAGFINPQIMSRGSIFSIFLLLYVPSRWRWCWDPTHYTSSQCW